MPQSANPDQKCTYKEAQQVAQWFNYNNIDQGVSKDPYSPWQPNAEPLPDDEAGWLVDTNGGSTGINCAMIRDRIHDHPQQAVQMTKDEFHH